MERNPADMKIDNSLAAVFTMMLPGLGQMLKGQGIPGLFWAAMVGGSYLVNEWLGLSFHIMCILDAALSGGEGRVQVKDGLIRKMAMISGVGGLVFYTCYRSSLF